ncbi:hypothetical protein [Pseudalkalibacillus salsuginis]|uniref:hypothetical protein n=1 Tax=Pseudalkalibacillus salsuginis TaxID=2910972 RepID=UPI001F1ED47C|nr:hypothetical protein [Pseudalkalibacillus salsuginis]MCF6410549.1 hypothetical protein [Pseudalkalibacillus salsuginis]
MKAMPIDSIMRNINRLNPAVELKPGQIFSGRLLALYPNDLAQVQLAGQKINAQLLAGLSLYENYWFKVKPNTKSGLPVLEVLEKSNDYHLPRQVFGSRKNSPELQHLITHLSKEQLPITKELIGQSGKWLSQVDSIEKGIQALKTMLIKNLPISEPIFRALYHVQDRSSLTTELLSLKQSLGTLGSHNVANSVDRAINRVLDMTNRNAALDIVKEMVQVYSLPTTRKEIKLQVEHILRALSIKIPDISVLENRFQNTNFPISDKALLKELKVNMSPVKAELFFQQKLNSLHQTQMNWISEQLNLKMVQKPQLNVIEILRGLGLTFEQDLVHGQLADMRSQPQLKAALLELLASDLPAGMKEMAEGLIHRLTGQQLLHMNENQSLTSLFYQFPVHFKEWKSDIMMRWDLKRNRMGEIDEDFSRILFYLDLQFLKETVVDMNVQNRVVSLKIINGKESVKQFIPDLKTELKTQLGKIGYRLSTVKIEKPSDQSSQLLKIEATDISFRGVDLSI